MRCIFFFFSKFSNLRNVVSFSGKTKFKTIYIYIYIRRSILIILFNRKVLLCLQFFDSFPYALPFESYIYISMHIYGWTLLFDMHTIILIYVDISMQAFITLIIKIKKFFYLYIFMYIYIQYIHLHDFVFILILLTLFLMHMYHFYSDTHLWCVRKRKD